MCHDEICSGISPGSWYSQINVGVHVSFDVEYRNHVLRDAKGVPPKDQFNPLFLDFGLILSARLDVYGNDGK